MLRKRKRSGTPADWLVVGLGNPGPEYARTRHNVGAETVELLASRHGGRLRQQGRERALIDEVRIRDRRVALAIPVTYMNESGMAVAPLVRRFGIDDVARLVVVHDELDLEPGVMRLKEGGGLAGHNGLRSIEQHLKSRDFVRVRIGVGKPRTKEQGADHVLSKLSKRARDDMDVTIQEAADAIEKIVTEGIEPAMNRYNTSGR